MIKSVSRSFYWASPFVLNRMFTDSDDHLGIEYWYNDVLEQHKDLEKKNKK